MDVTGFKNLEATRVMRSKAAEFLYENGIAENINTVFYPFSSYDGITSKASFPNADTIFAVDGAPFVKDLSLPISPRIGKTEIAGSFHTTGQSFETASVAEAVIARLLVADPQIQILRVTAIQEPGKSFHQRQTDAVLTHGVIEYLSGTRRRTYIHIETEIGDHVLNYWWYQQLKQHGFDALLLKATTSGLHGYSKALSADIYRTVVKNRVLVVDGDGQEPWLDSLPSIGALRLALPGLTGYRSGSVLFFPPSRALTTH